VRRFSRIRVGGALLGSVLAVGAKAGLAVASSTGHGQPAAGAGPAHWDVRVLARNPVVRVDGKRLKLSSPDDVTELGGRIFVTWQNGVGPQGQPAGNGIVFSVITEYAPGGRLIASWPLQGKCDGLIADPHIRTIIATINEDAHSSVDTIAPAARPGHQVVYYRYSPANPLPHGGGTDAISIDGTRILISASAPGTQSVTATGPAEMPAVYVAGFTRTAGFSAADRSGLE
jgi:hypothetical protein